EKLTSELNQKDLELNQTKSELSDKERAVQALTSTINQILGSRAWKAVQRYYRFRDKLLPPGSLRRGIAKSVLIPRISTIKKHIALSRDMRLVTASGLFDGEWYLQQNPDVAKSETDPLRHYLLLGAYEGRDPNPLFDSDWYLQQNPDVTKARVNPLVHFLQFGRAEGRFAHPQNRMNPPPAAFLPVAATSDAREHRGSVDVIIPVYKGFGETKACIESVLSSSCRGDFRVIVINDHSPEPDLAEFLRDLSRNEKITLIENARNLG